MGMSHIPHWSAASDIVWEGLGGGVSVGLWTQALKFYSPARLLLTFRFPPTDPVWPVCLLHLSPGWTQAVSQNKPSPHTPLICCLSDRLSQLGT